MPMLTRSPAWFIPPERRLQAPHPKAASGQVRDKRVKLPYEGKRDLIVPLAAHVEAVAKVLPRKYLLPYLVIDWTGVRLGALEEAKVQDLDEQPSRTAA
jgi:hypothetical protein